MVRDHSVILIRYKEDRLFESIVCAIPIKQGERIRALHDDRRGNLWIGTTYHLFRYSLEEGRLTTVCDDVWVLLKCYRFVLMKELFILQLK